MRQRHNAIPPSPDNLAQEKAMNARKTLVAFAARALLGYATTTMAGEWPARAGMDIEAARPSGTLELGAGSTVMLERPFKTVLIGNPDVVAVRTQSERSVLLKPLSPGATNLVFIDEQGFVITNLAILVRNAKSI
jgi:Flp pilus assembly secretin CpaC